jgi:hypothetical protein
VREEKPALVRLTVSTGKVLIMLAVRRVSG